MRIHHGRLIDHVHIKVRNLDAAKRFYGAVLEAMGIPLVEAETHAVADEVWIDEGEPHAHIHLAFHARDKATVERFYEAGLAAGGTDNGGPGEREYHPGYYAAFLYDPDGNNIEAVFHGPATYSADSVTIDFGQPS